jgi:hypothetical protein
MSQPGNLYHLYFSAAASPLLSVVQVGGSRSKSDFISGT